MTATPGRGSQADVEGGPSIKSPTERTERLLNGTHLCRKYFRFGDGALLVGMRLGDQAVMSIGGMFIFASADLVVSSHLAPPAWLIRPVSGVRQWRRATAAR